MSSIQVREVNVVPVAKIKKELLDEDESEDTVLCKICSKAFVSEMAVRNHARMEHIEKFMAGDDLYERPANSKRKYTISEEVDIQTRTSELISSMEPTAITSLASKDVSYIIIKDSDAVTVQKMRDLMKPMKQQKPPKQQKLEKSASKKERVVKPISGPFECLQPSSVNPDTLCHQMFLSCCEYSVHYRDEHTRRRKGNRCQVCEKHITGADQTAPYACQLCGVNFDNSKDLTDHSQTAHVKFKPFQCPECFKRFTQQGGLQQHMRRHTGDRPFACTFCPKAFTQKSGLDQHLRIHTKVKPYKCVICAKSFCQSVHLQQHMRTHTNVAPFQCGICQKRFKQSSHLNYHLKYHKMVTMTDEQKMKYVDLMTQMQIKQEFVEVDVEHLQRPQHEIDQSESGEQEHGQSESNTEIQEVIEEESNANDRMGEAVFVLNERHVWCEGVDYVK